jgi:tRNA/tmRNA/rRNA uracil-C5-methylase (TrmA/RlmC/RlmD family)
MHLSGDGQEQARRALVRSALDTERLHDVPLGTFCPSPGGLESIQHEATLAFGYSDQGHVRVGAWGRRDRRLVPIPRCNVLVPPLRHVMVTLAHHTIQRSVRPWVEQTEAGVLRAVVLRASRSTGEVLLTLVAARGLRELRGLAEDIAGQVSSVVGVWLHLNSEPGDALFSPNEDGSVPVRPLVGKETIEERIGDVTYAIGPVDSFHSNPAMAELRYARALERCGLAPEVPVVVLHSGVGGMALQVAGRTEWVVGVEETSVARARENARRQGLRAEFAHGPLVDVLAEMGRRLRGRSPVVVVDPARRGLGKAVVEGILALRARRVVYLSGNPRAMARDLAAFQRAGKRIGEVEMFDTFPNTARVECLVTVEGEVIETSPGRAPRRKVVR